VTNRAHVAMPTPPTYPATTLPPLDGLLMNWITAVTVVPKDTPMLA
jgi:hypothetical protein